MKIAVPDLSRTGEEKTPPPYDAFISRAIRAR